MTAMLFGLMPAAVDATPGSDDAAAGREYQIAIPQSELNLALRELARQTGLQIAYFTDERVLNTAVGPMSGTLTREQAVARLLSGTGLSYRLINDDTVAIVNVTSSGTSRPGAATPDLANKDAARSAAANCRNKYPDASRLWTRMALLMGWCVTAAGPVGAQETSMPQASLEEIVVTAQKRSERLHDVPVPVTAMTGDLLAGRGQFRFEDYFTTVPGLNINTLGNGQTNLAIRGLSTGSFTNPVVGITIDDIPFGSSSTLGFGSRLIPDLDPSDLARVEVLRGPQGTLYGASSIGGLLKFVTVDPSTTEFSGRAYATATTVANGSTGYGVGGAVNLPVSDTFAIRASAATRTDPGYIDAPHQGRTGIGEADVKRARLSALWSPLDSLSIKLSVLAQDVEGNGTPQVDADYRLRPTLGDLAQDRLRGTETYESKFRLYSLAVNTSIGDLDFTSLTGYGVSSYDNIQDATIDYGPVAEELFGVSGAGLGNAFETQKLTQEFRLSSPLGRTVDWLIGAFYTHEDTPAVQFLTAFDPASGAVAGEIGDFAFPTTVAELAGFADLTVNFTDRFDVQIGGRLSQNKQRYSEVDTGPIVGGHYVNPTERSEERSFTYLLTPRFRISPDFMVYARAASGYRVGGPNPTAVLFGLPTEYEADETLNFDVGIKGNVLEERIAFDVSAYHIAWRNLQVFLKEPETGFGYFANAGKAKSWGVEAAVQVAPSDGLTIAATITSGRATLAEDLPAGAGVGVSGDRLPYGTRFTGNLSADQEFALTSTLTGFVGATVTHVGDRYGDFAIFPELVRVRYPSYSTWDLRAGATNGSWTVNLVASNLGDKRGVIGGGSRSQVGGTEADPFWVTYIRPRTFGLSVSRNF